MRSAIKLLFFGFIVLFAGNLSVQAQIPISVGGIELTASVDNPIPEQIVTITARSYSVDINTATISWSVGGKVISQGIGETVAKVKAPALGTVLNVTVSAVLPDGNRLTKSISIGSGSVDMIVETDGHVPAFFHGKAPEGYQNNIKIIAIGHIADSRGVQYDPQTLIYRWKKNNQAIEDQSGYGKQSVVVAGDIVPRAYVISVTAETRDGKARAESSVSISPQAPEIVFYIDDPLYGPMFNAAVNESIRIGSEREVSVLALPFGFNKPKDSSGNLSFSWMINNASHPELDSSQSIVLRAPDTGAGSSEVLVSVRNIRNILQSAQSGFAIVFGPSATQSTSDLNF
ncbi:MAG: hypothetical protein A3B11_00580 [Candidatus Taylorbacteria bacterium RIFCSPLOWO2_01_FULL_44_26]|uniref:Uncharacterized protein n=2 Tax=Candidatus Tayloriibacteriota TaxID=1817919 RepID=A0A1G2MLD4_9BACT|nr:MAG: hypothetical protein A3D50_00495 [Candidatus Taylorbacteria bacterium RIFCSPHIGHO2_02_FULL_44_12]OHA31180.1 MAG: hypothetical protein A3B11_00580 [Candidatus Taylorbacteria bacterium RIFCSPLOWO2_01_FULL_44_26]